MANLQVSELTFLDWEAASFVVAAGECVGLAGESGSGKSLLLRGIADLDPHGGDAVLGGDRCSEMPPAVWRKRVGMLASESRWWFDEVRPHFPEEVDAELFEGLGFSGDEVLDWEVRRLSAGERQRLALARLLARRPEALLLDEPTANLDARSAEMVEALIEGYRQQHGAPVLWVGHSAEQLRRVADRGLRMADKRLREEGGDR
jgi:ABC-type iron transport system FetAB ATPase subunit